jgi:hypothetical protein
LAKKSGYSQLTGEEGKGEEGLFKWTEPIPDPSKTFEKPKTLADIKTVELCTLILGLALPG